MSNTRHTGLRVADRVTPEHGRVFVDEWFREKTPMLAPDAFAATQLMQWPDEISNVLTPAQKRYEALEEEIMKRTFEPLRDVIAASFVLAAADVLGRDLTASDAPPRPANGERYASYEPEVRAVLDVARAAVRAEQVLPRKVVSSEIIEHLAEAAGGWAWSLINIIMEYEEKERERS